MAAEHPVPELSDEVRKQIGLLASKDPKTCLTAMQTLRDLKTDAVTESLLNIDKRDRRNFPRILGGMLCFSLFIGTLACIGSYAMTGQVAWGGWVGIAPPLIFLSWHLRQSRNSITLALAALEDVRSVGPLVDSLEFGDSKTRALAKITLTRLLPRLQASDAHLLNQAQRHALHKILIGMDTRNARSSCFGPMRQSNVQIHIDRSIDKAIEERSEKPMSDDLRLRFETLQAARNKYAHKFVDEDALRVAILKALEQVGGADSLPYVQDVAAGETKTAQGPQVRRAAQECLPFLQARAAKQTARGTLLRPVETTDPNPETLVRPAVETHDYDLQELLRQSEKPQ